jgi:hypothetical protein
MNVIAVRANVLTRVWRWIKGQMIGMVPDDIGLCQFSCNKQQCTMGEWATCERRIHKAAGELMPLEPPAAVLPPETAAQFTQAMRQNS